MCGGEWEFILHLPLGSLLAGCAGSSLKGKTIKDELQLQSILNLLIKTQIRNSRLWYCELTMMAKQELPPLPEAFPYTSIHCQTPSHGHAEVF